MQRSAKVAFELLDFTASISPSLGMQTELKTLAQQSQECHWSRSSTIFMTKAIFDHTI